MHRNCKCGDSKSMVASQALIKTDAVIDTSLYQTKHHARGSRQEHMQAAANKRCPWGDH